MQHIVESDMLVASASDSDIRAVHRNISEAQRKDMRSTFEPPKVVTWQSTSVSHSHWTFRGWWRAMSRTIMWGLGSFNWTCYFSDGSQLHDVSGRGPIPVARITAWLLEMGSKRLVYLCKVTRIGLQDDGGNWCHGIAIIVMAGACTQNPENWRLARYSDSTRLCHIKPLLQKKCDEIM